MHGFDGPLATKRCTQNMFIKTCIPKDKSTNPPVGPNVMHTKVFAFGLASAKPSPAQPSPTQPSLDEITATDKEK